MLMMWLTVLMMVHDGDDKSMAMEVVKTMLLFIMLMVTDDNGSCNDGDESFFNESL